MLDPAEALLREALVAANRRGDVAAFVSAQARLELHREIMEARPGRFPNTYAFDPKLHPRNRLGKFVEVLDLLKQDKRGKVTLPEGFMVTRSMTGKWHLHGGDYVTHPRMRTTPRVWRHYGSSRQPDKLLTMYDEERKRIESHKRKRQQKLDKLYTPAYIESLGGF